MMKDDDPIYQEIERFIQMRAKLQKSKGLAESTQLPESTRSAELIRSLPPHIRVIGHHQSAEQLLGKAIAANRFPCIQSLALHADADYDYAQIDPALEISPPDQETPITPPKAQVGYAGLTPQQRYRMVEWLHWPLEGAPNGIQQHYVAQLESALFNHYDAFNLAQQALKEVLESDAWQYHEGLGRAMLLSFWLRQDGKGLDLWLAQNQLAPSLIGVTLGHLALLGEPLSPEIFPLLAEQLYKSSVRDASTPLPSKEILSLRLSSLSNSLNADPLNYALKQLPGDALAPRPWRCSHRDLRIAIPQPDLTPILQPLIMEAVTAAVTEAADWAVVQSEALSLEGSPNEDEDSSSTSEKSKRKKQQPSQEDEKWRLVLEFGHSRSEYFDFALFRARQRSNYTQIMDENRNIVHRVIFTRGEMRHFWVLWEYVQHWSATHVYVRGQEIEKSKVYRYSQFLE